MSEPAYVQEQLSVLNNCYSCMVSDQKCTDCQEDFDNQQTVRAHQLVDDGSITESSRPMSWLVDMPSGHDWIAPLVRLNDGSVRQEFVDPVVSMEDRTFNPELEVATRETICASCHLVCWAELPCPNCEEVNL